MSMFKVTCPKCGQDYLQGVVGMTFYGHSCPTDGMSPEAARFFKESIEAQKRNPDVRLPRVL